MYFALAWAGLGWFGLPANANKENYGVHLAVKSESRQNSLSPSPSMKSLAFKDTNDLTKETEKTEGATMQKIINDKAKISLAKERKAARTS